MSSQRWVRDDTLVPLRISLEHQRRVQGQDLSVGLCWCKCDGFTTYLNNELYSHIVGYVQRVSAEDLEKEGYRDRDLIGRQELKPPWRNLRISGYSLI